MKLSVSLPDADVEFLDAFARERHLGSRSASLRQAVALLRAAQLGSSYDAAWTEWQDVEWDVTSGDGVEERRASR